jgi:UDP-N-acetylglucosamine acyltransferase
MAYSHVGHDCIIGSHCVMSNCTALAGHVELGDWVILSGYSGVHQFCKVGAHSFLANNAAVTRDVPPTSWLGAGGTQASTEGLKRRGFSRANPVRNAYRRCIIGLKLPATEQLQALAAEQPN